MFYKYRQENKKPNILDRYSGLFKILFYENNMEPFHWDFVKVKRQHTNKLYSPWPEKVS